MRGITLTAHAKINLALDVLARRPDGYHQVEMVLQTLELADRVTVWPAEGIQLRCDHPEVPAGEENLAWRAARLLLKRAGYAGGVGIHVEKRIPVAAGLGGGSADAAATLRAVNALLGLGASREELLDLAAELGSDVPFCLLGGTVLATGRGENLQPLPAAPMLWVVLVKPSRGLSTAHVYREWDYLPAPRHPDVQAVVRAVREGDGEALLASVGNGLTAAAARLCPEILDLLEGLRAAGAAAVLLCGSGPTCAGLARTRAQAENLAAALAGRGPVIVTRTVTAETASGGAV